MRLEIETIPYCNVRNLWKRKVAWPSQTLTSKGQITIPVQVRTALGVDAGDRIEFVEIEKGQFVILAANRSVRELNGFLQRKRKKPVSIEEMNAAIAQGAARSR